jgi:multidrug resistance efflux pump
VLLLALGAVAGSYLYARRSQPAPPSAVRVSGNLEVTEVVLSFRVAGWVKARPAAEGQELQAGAPVAELDATEMAQQVALSQAGVKASQATLAELLAGARPEETAQAEAAVQRAQAVLAELEAGARPVEIAIAGATAEAASVEAAYLKGELERARSLSSSGVIPAQELAAAQSRAAAAAAQFRAAQEHEKLVKEGSRREQLDQARAALRQTSEQLALVQKGPRQEVIDQAQARLEQARASQDMALTRLGYATLTAPSAGVVLSEGLQAGEYAMPGAPVVTLGDVLHPWLRAYISTPVRASELVLGKLVPYFVIGMADVALAVAMGQWLFGVPLRGSAALVFGLAAVFLAGTLAMGLLISILTRNQLVANQVAMVLTFLPAFLLSGFVFAVVNMPRPLQLVTYLVPARFFIALLRGVYLKGVGLEILAGEAVLLAGFGAVMLGLANLMFRKKLE